MLFFNLLLIFVALASAMNSHRLPSNTEDFTCPFHHRHDQTAKCLRHPSKWSYPAESLQRRVFNIRPDIPQGQATRSQLLSESRCCYEIECLQDCGIYRADIYNNDMVQELPESGLIAIEEYPSFFNDAAKETIHHCQDKPIHVYGNCQIMMFHLSLALDKHAHLEQKYRTLDNLINNH